MFQQPQPHNHLPKNNTEVDLNQVLTEQECTLIKNRALGEHGVRSASNNPVVMALLKNVFDELPV